MSYDLMVFAETKAPKTKADFLKWYEAQTEWSEDHSYDSIQVTAKALQNWFMEMKETFPPMNGEYAPGDDLLAEVDGLEEHLTDYCIGRDVIYTAFAWSVADEAYALMKQTAKKHGVGFFDVSGSDGEIYLADGTQIQ